MMSWLYRQRAGYIRIHQQEFVSEADKQAYIKEWVANFEISDWLQTHPQPGVVFFARHVETQPENVSTCSRSCPSAFY